MSQSNQQIEALVNAYYTEWIKTNDPIEDDFEEILYEIMPDYRFGQTQGISKVTWYIIQIL